MSIETASWPCCPYDAHKILSDPIRSMLGFRACNLSVIWNRIWPGWPSCSHNAHKNFTIATDSVRSMVAMYIYFETEYGGLAGCSVRIMRRACFNMYIISLSWPGWSRRRRRSRSQTESWSAKQKVVIILKIWKKWFSCEFNYAIMQLYNWQMYWTMYYWLFLWEFLA